MSKHVTIYNKQDVIGKTMDETEHLDWYQHWPIIDKSGTILDVVDSEFDPWNCITVEWINGKPVEVDGENGFDAYLQQ